MTFPPPPQNPPGASPYGYAQPPVPKKGRGLAITSLVLGILGCLLGLIPILGFVSFPLGVIGILFGLIGLTGNREGKGMSIAGTILSVLAIVLAIVGIVIVNKAVDDLGDSLDDVSGNSTTSILRDDLDVQIGSYATDGNEVFESGKLIVTLKNKSDAPHSYSVTIEAKDAAGNRIEEDTVYVSDLGPAQSVNEDAFVLASSDKIESLKTAKFEVREATKS